MFFLLIVFILLCVTAILSSSETALTVASKAKISQMIKEGNKRAILVKELQDKAASIIPTFLICSTLIDMTISFMSGIWASKFLGDFGQMLVGIFTTVLVLSYGESVPKMIAFRFPESILLKMAPLLKIISQVFYFLNWTMTKIAELTIKIFKMNSYTMIESNEELRGYIEMHIQQLSEEKNMLNSILDLEKVTLRDIMVFRSNVERLNADDSFENIIHIIQKTVYSRLPVWKDQPDNIVGIVHTKAFLDHFLRHGMNKENFNLLALCHKPWFAPETTTLLEQLKEFKLRHEHFVMIVDEYGVFQGIVTLEDVLEEIVGEINDEYDIHLHQTSLTSEGALILPGNFTVRDLNRQFNFNLQNTEATIAGLLLQVAQKIPETGSVYEIQNTRFEVLKRHKNYISLVKVFKSPEIFA